MKRSPLKRYTPLRGSATISRKRHSPRRSTRLAAQSVIDAVRRRSKGICELCRGREASEMHHRKRRSAGGPDLSDNLLHLCHHCHHVTIHGNGDWAYRHGLLLRRSSTTYPAPITDCALDCTVDHID